MSEATQKDVTKPGKYVARIMDATLTATKNGDAQVAVLMEFKDGEGQTRRLTWFGAMNGGAREITVETLVRLGYKSDDLADLTKGKEMFNDVDYEIVVDMHTYNGKTYPRINWINLLGGSTFRAKMTREDAVKLTGGLNLKGDFLAARGGKPAVPPQIQPPVSHVASAPEISEADLPF